MKNENIEHINNTLIVLVHNMALNPIRFFPFSRRPNAISNKFIVFLLVFYTQVHKFLQVSLHRCKSIF